MRLARRDRMRQVRGLSKLGIGECRQDRVQVAERRKAKNHAAAMKSLQRNRKAAHQPCRSALPRTAQSYAGQPGVNWTQLDRTSGVLPYVEARSLPGSTDASHASVPSKTGSRPIL